MKIIIHFGMHKTGSSSIQQSLFRHLSDEHFHYLCIKGANQNTSLMTAFSDTPETYHTYRKLGSPYEQIQSLRIEFKSRLSHQLKHLENKIPLMSAEAISSMNQKSLIELKQFLSDFYQEIQLVGYVRPPKAFMESAFQQRIKGGGTKFRPQALLPNYEKTRVLDEVFSRDNVNFWKFDPPAFVGGDVVMDFCNRLGIQFDPSLSVRVNEGLSLSALKLLFAYRKFGPGYGVGPTVLKENNCLIEAIKEIKGQKLRFHSDLVRPLLKNNADQISWMEERLGASLSEDITKDDDIAIRNEGDLFNIDEKTTQWLAKQLGSEYENRWHEKLTPQEIADWMHVLRQKLTLEAEQIKTERTLNKKIKIQPEKKQPVQENKQLVQPLTYLKTINESEKDCFQTEKAFAKLELHEKPLSKFLKLSNTDELLTCSEDSIFIYENGQPLENEYLNDITGSPYILSLHNPLLIPAKTLDVLLPKVSNNSQPLPKKLKYKNRANLLLTQQHEVIADSFSRTGKFVHEAVSYHGSGRWEVPMIEITEKISGPCVFIDLVCGHFGHALVDTPARLWLLLEEYGFVLQDYTFVGFGMQQLKDDPETWPYWLKQLLSAYGIPLTRLRILDKPVCCQTLLVPKRISPYINNGGLPYNKLMQQAGDRLLTELEKPHLINKKIFLSRSHLEKEKRELGNEVLKNLDALFVELGFKVFHPQELSLAEQVAVIRNATHIVGCVGSQLHLTAFCNQPFFKVLRIAPVFFAQNTDAKIIKPIGGMTEDYLIHCNKQLDKKPFQSHWTLTEADFDNLRRFVIDWLVN